MTLKELRKFSCRIVRYTNAAVLSALTAYSPVAWSMELKLQGALPARSLEGDSMKVSGTLPLGTTVTIPDDYAVQNPSTGNIDVELTLNNWLRQKGYTPTRSSVSEKSDYYFPVKVVNSHTNLDGTIQYVALRQLARVNKAIIVADDNADAYEFPQSQSDMPYASVANSDARPDTPPPARLRRQATTPAPKARAVKKDDDDASLEAGYSCPDGRCNQVEDRSSSVSFDALKKSLSSAAATEDRMLSRLHARVMGNTRDLDSNFRSTCGVSLSSFASELDRMTSGTELPASVLMALMTQESSGLCAPIRHERNGTKSIGLFQINIGGRSPSSRVPRCSAGQLSQIRSIHTISEMKSSGPQCLENPLVNAKEAIRILNSKLDAVTGRGGFNMSELNRNSMTKASKWRIAIAAYNGGQVGVLAAKRSLEDFNRSHNTHLQASNWEDLRVFMLRRALSSNSRSHRVRVGHGRHRHYKWVKGGGSNNMRINNLAYTEDVIPRDARYRTTTGQTIVDYFDGKYFSSGG